MICILILRESGEKSISHGKPYEMHFLAYFSMTKVRWSVNTLCKVEDHENHVGWIYLTTVLYMGESQKYAEKHIYYKDLANCFRKEGGGGGGLNHPWAPLTCEEDTVYSAIQKQAIPIPPPPPMLT